MGFLDRVLGDLMRDTGGRNARRLLRRVGGKKLLLAGGVAAADTLLNPSTGAPRGSGYGFTKGPVQQPATPPPAVPEGGLPPIPGVAAGPGLPRGSSQPLAGGAESPSGPMTMANAVPAPAGVVPPPSAPSPAIPAIPPPSPVDDAAPFQAEASDSRDVDALQLPAELTFAAVRTMIAAALSDGHLDAEERQAVEARLAEAELSASEVERIHKDLVLPASARELAALATDDDDRDLLFQLAVAVVAADGQVLAPEQDWLRGLATAFALPEGRARELERAVLAELLPASDGL